MKKIALVFAYLFCAVLVLRLTAFAQTAQTPEWIRVQNDNGEFSIEVPAKHNYFYDKDGFWVARDFENYRLQKVNLLNAYRENTLLSFETYEARKGALEVIINERDQNLPEATTSNFNRSGVSIKQTVIKTDKYYCVRQYFNSKTSIYILTAVSRNGENEVMKRFFDSLVFKPDTKENKTKIDPNSVLFSSLKATEVIFTVVKEEDEKNKNPTVSTDKAKSDNSRFVIAKRPIPAYIDLARMKGIQGVIKLRITFSEDGFIPKIAVVKSLPDGLLRQAVFALLRMKFLPEEEAGKAVSTTKMVEYHFTIYQER